MSVRVVRGEIGVKDVTTRTVVPTAAQPRWPPFERVAETIATPRRPFPRHRHEGVEVLTYVIEGLASYAADPGPPTPLEAGSVRLLTAPTPTFHAINPGKGQTVRWFSAVASLPAGASAGAGLQSDRPAATEGEAAGATVVRLVGPGSRLTSAAGLQALVIEHSAPGTSFQRVGHDRVAVCYALAGRGAIDNDPLDVGEAALVQDAAAVSVQGQTGFRAVVLTAPKPP
jgi:quercetin 2,3-dioxygenase